MAESGLKMSERRAMSTSESKTVMCLHDPQTVEWSLVLREYSSAHAKSRIWTILLDLMLQDVSLAIVYSGRALLLLLRGLTAAAYEILVFASTAPLILDTGLRKNILIAAAHEI